MPEVQQDFRDVRSSVDSDQKQNRPRQSADDRDRRSFAAERVPAGAFAAPDQIHLRDIVTRAAREAVAAMRRTKNALLDLSRNILSDSKEFDAGLRQAGREEPELKKEPLNGRWRDTSADRAM